MQSVLAKTEANRPVCSAEFRQGMRKLAASVAIIAAASGDRRRGLTVTAVCSVSADPPRVAVCVNKESSAHDTIVQAQAFSLNMLGSDQIEIARAFSGAVEADKRFSDDDWHAGPTGLPMLRGALVAFECDLEKIVDATTHHIFIGAVRGIENNPQEDPLLYHDRQYKFLSYPEIF